MRQVGMLLVVLAGCVGTNPFWDGPVAASGTVGANDDDDDDEHDAGVDDGMNGGDAADSDSTSGGASESSDGPGAVGSADAESTSSDVIGSTTSGSDASTSGAGTSGMGETTDACEPGQVICDGECKEVWQDKHYCGAGCIDCTELFGNNAKCEDGVCEPHDGNGNDDED